MTIKHIQARFTSGNDIPIDKAMVPADEWRMAMAEIQVLKDQFIWDKMAFERLEKLCDDRGVNELRMYARLREAQDEIGQLQEQNRWLDEKLADVEKDAARYQWLRKNPFSFGHGSLQVFMDDRCGSGSMHKQVWDSVLDAAIDKQLGAK